MMLKDRLKELIMVISFIVLIYALSQWSSRILDPADAQVGLDVIEAFHSLDDNSLDVIVYGSSRAFKGCDTKLMSDRYNMSAYNYSCNWLSLNTSLLFLKDSLRTQTPKVACIEVGILDDLEVGVPLDAQNYYTRKMPFFDGKWEFLHQCFGDRSNDYATYFFPIIAFHQNWKDMHSENFRAAKANQYVESRGYYETDEIKENEFMDYEEMEQLEIPEESLPYLQEMVDVCKKNNVQVIFYTTPYAWIYNYSDAMDEFAEKNDCVYLNLFKHLDELGLNGETDLSDTEHLNRDGAAKVAMFLGKYIVENYDMH